MRPSQQLPLGVGVLYLLVDQEDRAERYGAVAWLRSPCGTGTWAEVDEAMGRVMGVKVGAYLVDASSQVVHLGPGRHIVEALTWDAGHKLLGSFDEDWLAREELRLLREHHPERVFELRVVD